MKSDTMNTVLNLALAVLALVGVILAMRTIMLTRTLRSYQMAPVYNNYLMTVQAMAADAAKYAETHPDLKQLLSGPAAKPAGK